MASSPTPTPVEEILDIPSPQEISRLLQDPGSPEAQAALGKVRAAAVAQGDGRAWLNSLIQEARSLTYSRPLPGGKSSVVDWPNVVRRVEEAVSPPPATIEVARLLLLANLHENAARAAEWPGPADAESIARHREGADAVYARAFARRGELAETPRDGLVFADRYGPPGHDSARDVVTYLYASFLEEQSKHQTLERPDVSALLTSPLREPAPGSPALIRFCAVLDDLERWHATKEQREAALEARLERLRVLFAVLPEARGAVVADLKRRLPMYRDFAAFSSGMAQLALFVDEEAMTAKEALEVADRGREAYPSSTGGQRCGVIARILRLEIEDPELSVGSPGPVTSPGASILLARHRGAARLQLRATLVPLEDLLEDRWPRFFAALREDGKPGSAETVTWSVELPAPGERRSTVTAIHSPLTKRGLYRVEASIGAQSSDLPATGLILVSDLRLSLSEDETTLRVRAISVSTGQPVEGVEMRLYRRASGSPPESKLLETKLTDRDGVARFARPVSANPPSGGSIAVTARHGDDAAHVAVQLVQAERKPIEAAPRVLLALDNPQASPGDTVRWWALARGSARTPIPFTLRDSKGSPLSSFQATPDENGIATGEVSLPALPLPATSFSLTADVRTQVPASASSASPTPTPLAAAYISGPPPPAPLEVVLDGFPMLSSHARVELHGTVRRDGKPLPGAAVAWSLRAPTNQSKAGRHAAEDVPVAIRLSPPRAILSGTVRAGPAGGFDVSFEAPEILERTYSDTIELEVDDGAGRTATFSRQIFASPSAVVLEIRGRTILRPGERGTVLVRRLRPADRAPQPGSSTVRILSLPIAPELSLDYRRPEPPRPDIYHSIEQAAPETSEELLARLADGPLVAKLDVEHDAMGEGRLELPALPAGLYRLAVESRDGNGIAVRTVRPLVVDGARVPVPLPLTLLADDPESGSRRIYVAGSRTAFVELLRPAHPIEIRRVGPPHGLVLDVDGDPAEVVAARVTAVHGDRLLALEKQLQPRLSGLRMRLVGPGRAPAVRVQEDDGRPIADVALIAVAVESGQYLYGLDARSGGGGSFRLPTTSQAGSPFGMSASLRPPSATEWGRIALPELPVERAPLFQEVLSMGCGTGMPPPPRPKLPPPSARGAAVYRSRQLLQPSQSHAARVWEPNLRTDRDGVARMTWAVPSDGRSYRVAFSAVAPDGRVGYLETVVDGVTTSKR